MAEKYAILGCAHAPDFCKRTGNCHKNWTTLNIYGDGVDRLLDVCDPGANGLDTLGEKDIFNMLYSERCCGMGKVLRDAYDNKDYAIEIVKKLEQRVTSGGVFIFRFCDACDRDGYVTDGIIRRVLEKHTSFVKLGPEETLECINLIEDLDEWPDAKPLEDAEIQQLRKGRDLDSIWERVATREEVKRVHLASWGYLEKMDAMSCTPFSRDEQTRIMERYEGIFSDFIADCADTENVMEKLGIMRFAIEKKQKKRGISLTKRIHFLPLGKRRKKTKPLKSLTKRKCWKKCTN